MTPITIVRKEQVHVAYLHAECGRCYWEDAFVNGVRDDAGILIPCRDGDAWCPTIHIETGRIEGWPAGTVADIHYKVCDEGVYTLLDDQRRPLLKVDGYVPDIMCPGGAGYGDYVIMRVDAGGYIQNWVVDLDDFERRAGTEARMQWSIAMQAWSRHRNRAAAFAVNAAPQLVAILRLYQAITNPTEELVERVGLAILNYHKDAAWLPLVESRDRIADSDGYPRNARAALHEIASIACGGAANG